MNRERKLLDTYIVKYINTPYFYIILDFGDHSAHTYHTLN